MQLSVTRCGASFNVAVAGEVDLAESDNLIDAVMLALRNRGCARVRLDLSGVTFIDCAGLSALLRIRREAEKHHSSIKMVCASACVRRLLVLTQLHGALPVS